MIFRTEIRIQLFTGRRLADLDPFVPEFYIAKSDHGDPISLCYKSKLQVRHFIGTKLIHCLSEKHTYVKSIVLRYLGSSYAGRIDRVLVPGVQLY